MNTQDESPEKESVTDIAEAAQQAALAAKEVNDPAEVPAKETARFLPSLARGVTVHQANSNSHPG